MLSNTWIKSEDAGYSAGRLLLQREAGEWVVSKCGSRWTATWVSGKIGHKPKTFPTRKAAMEWCQTH